MSIEAVTPAILDTVLAHLAPHFLAAANGDLPTARHAASRMLAAYNAETPAELRLATEIVSFSFHALESLGEAANPDLSLNGILRLRGNAVSLSREAHKAQRKLDHLQQARLTRTPPAEVTPSRYDPEPSLPTAIPRPAANNPDTSVMPALMSSQQERRTAHRMSNCQRRNQAEQQWRGQPQEQAMTVPIRAETASHRGPL